VSKRQVKPPVIEVRRCRVCGCTDDRACEGGCSWIEADLCSACVETAERFAVVLTKPSVGDRSHAILLIRENAEGFGMHCLGTGLSKQVADEIASMAERIRQVPIIPPAPGPKPEKCKARRQGGR
jgi:hypothetical protein